MAGALRRALGCGVGLTLSCAPEAATTTGNVPDPTTQGGTDLWLDRSFDTPDTLRAVYRTGGGAWMVGTSGGVFWQNDGGVKSLESPSMSTLNAVRGDASELVAVGDGGAVVRWSDGSGFGEQTLGGADLRALDGRPGALTAVGWSGVYEQPSGSWASREVDARLNGVYLGPLTAVAVGQAGATFRRDAAQAWSEADAGVSADLHTVTGIDDTEQWAAGAAGTVLHGDGASWTSLTITADGRLVDASAATPADQPYVGSLNAIWEAPDRQVFVVGEAGAVFELDAATETATRLPTPTSADLYGVSGMTSDDVWAVGVFGTVLWYPGPDD